MFSLRVIAYETIPIESSHQARLDIVNQNIELKSMMGHCDHSMAGNRNFHMPTRSCHCARATTTEWSCGGVIVRIV